LILADSATTSASFGKKRAGIHAHAPVTNPTIAAGIRASVARLNDPTTMSEAPTLAVNRISNPPSLVVY